MHEKLIIYKKAQEFLYWINLIVPSFTKAHKYSLGIKLENAMLDFIVQIIRTNMSRDKITQIDECFIRYETVVVLVRIARHFHLIDINQYEFASEQISEMGRVMGGWRKSFQGGGQQYS